jgi:general secretion pathway protein A
VLEEIRLLTNLETATEKLLQIVLSGQPELEEKLKLPEVRQLRQRIMLRCKTGPLSKEQTFEYIQERLRIAGAGPEPIFSKQAMDTVHLYSLGVARVINLLCEHSLVNAYADQQRPIGPKIVEEVAHEFQLDEVGPLAPSRGAGSRDDVYTSEAFIQNLGEALSKFRVTPAGTTGPGRKWSRE